MTSSHAAPGDAGAAREGGGGPGVPGASRRALILVICCVSLFMNYLDGTILNVALPTLAHTFHAGEAALQWIVDSFLLALTCLLVLAGSLADRFGRRRVLVIGLVVFVAGSLGCSLAGSVSELVAWRIVAGIGGSMLVPTTLSIVRNTFHGPELARAIGVWSGVYGLACACGPLVGGALIDGEGWRAIFLVNIPVGLTGAALALRFVPESVAQRPRRIDGWGEVLLIAALGTLVFTVIEAPDLGWASRPVALGFLGSALLAVAFVAVETRAKEPLVEIRLFSDATFAGANVLAALTFVLMTGFLFVNTIYLQQVRALSPFRAGLMTLPLMGAITLCAPLSGRYLSRHGPRFAMVGSALFALAAYGLLAAAGGRAPLWLLGLAYATLGVAFGAVNPAITHTTVVGMPPGQAGVASAITSASRQVGSSLGVAILGSVAVTSLGGGLAARLAGLGLSPRLRGIVAGDGLQALSTPFGAHGAAIHAAAQDAYSGALGLIWWIGSAAALVWLAVAWGATRATGPLGTPAPARPEPELR